MARLTDSTDVFLQPRTRAGTVCVVRSGLVGLVAAAIAIVATGCSGFKPPKIEHLGAELTERSPEAAVYQVTIRATNPNDESMPLRELNYSLAFDNGAVVSGGRSPEATVPAFGTLDVSFPAVYLGEAPPAGTGYGLSGELVYVSPGEFADVLFDAGVSRPTVSLRGRGVTTD